MLHNLLNQQLQSLGLDVTTPPDASAWQQFLDHVGETYAHFGSPPNSSRKSADSELQRQLSQTLLLNQVMTAATSALEADAVLRIVCEELARALKLPQAAVALLSEDKTYLKVVAEYLEEGRPPAMGIVIPVVNNPATQYVLEHRQSLLLVDAQSDKRQEIIHHIERQRGTVSLLIVPLIIRDEVIGTLGLDAIEKRVFSEEDIALAESVAAAASQALANAGLYSAVQQELEARKQVEEQLKQQRDFGLQVMNTMGQGLLVADPAWRFEFVNAAFAMILGYTPGQLIGKTPRDVLFEDDYADFMASQFGRSRVENAEVRLRCYDGSAVYTLVTIAPRWLGGKIAGFIGVITDLTEQKRTERELYGAKEAAEAATQVKSEFLANMSHEIRTPLNAVIGMTGLLLDTPLAAEQRDFVETIRHSSDNLLTIINDILDFSKIEAGKLELEEHPFSLRACVEESLDLLAGKAAEKGLDMIYFVDDSLPDVVIGDVTRLRQILVNLISNGVKFTERGEVVVHGSGCRLEGERYEIHFSVRDTGIGIPARRMNRLFQPFSQVDTSTTRQYGGTGLGLIISKHLVEMMGGNIWAESEVRKGSTFNFTIQVTALSQELPDLASPVLLNGKRVLIVDDNETNRFILARQTQAWGMTASTAASGPVALDQMSQEQFDLVILDMQMPHMYGLSLATEMSKRNPGQTPPLIMLTSLDQRADLVESRLFSALLTKPIKPVQLHRALTDAYAGRTTAVIRERLSPFDDQMGRRHPLRILLVEDNAVNQKVFLRILERLGYRTDVAANGLEALSALRRQPYDVVLMDIQMPEMDGLEATRVIRQQWPAEQRPRIIAMTAHALVGDRERYLANGMDDYISKPIEVKQLAEALYQCRPRTDHLTPAAARSPLADAGAPMSSTWPIDMPVLEMAMGPDAAGLLVELLPLFFESAASMLAVLELATVTGNFQQLQDSAHTLKGSSGSLGMLSLSGLCQDVEAMARLGRLAEAAERVARARAEFEKIKLALANSLEGTANSE